MEHDLKENHVRLLQQIIAYDGDALSVEEIDYRNTDLEVCIVENLLRELEHRGLIAATTVDTSDDLPSKFFAVTEKGETHLKKMGMYDEIEVLSKADSALDRTARIRKIESIDHPSSDEDA